MELNAPSLDANGVCSDVVSCTLTVKGVVGTPLEARQVAASLIPETTISDNFRARKSGSYRRCWDADVDNPVMQSCYDTASFIDHPTKHFDGAEGRAIRGTMRQITDWR